MSIFSRDPFSRLRKNLKVAEKALLRADIGTTRSYLEKIFRKELNDNEIEQFISNISLSEEKELELLQIGVDLAYGKRVLLNRIAELKARFEKEAERQALELERLKMMQLAEPSLSRGTFVGQEQIIAGLRTRIEKARRNGESLEHILFTGPEEIGKATLARVVAIEIQSNLTVFAPSGKRSGDLAGVVTNLGTGDILLVENVEQLNRNLLDSLIPVIEAFEIDIVIGKGPDARPIKLELPPFTLIGTTSSPSQIDRKLIRWLAVFDFTPYSKQETSRIIQLLAQRQGFDIDPVSSELIARYCDGLPGHANVIVKRVGKLCTSVENTNKALESIGYTSIPTTSVEIAKSLQKLSGAEFEEYVANVFRKKGYQVEITNISGDHGIDLLMQKGKEKIAVQCKRWSDPVGEGVVRDFYGSLLHQGAKLGCIIATTTYSDHAKEFAQGKPIKLIDFDGFIRIVLDKQTK